MSDIPTALSRAHQRWGSSGYNRLDLPGADFGTGQSSNSRIQSGSAIEFSPSPLPARDFPCLDTFSLRAHRRPFIRWYRRKLWNRGKFDLNWDECEYRVQASTRRNFPGKEGECYQLYLKNQTKCVPDQGISVMFPRPIYRFCLHHNCPNAVIKPVSKPGSRESWSQGIRTRITQCHPDIATSTRGRETAAIRKRVRRTG